MCIMSRHMLIQIGRANVCPNNINGWIWGRTARNHGSSRQLCWFPIVFFSIQVLDKLLHHCRPPCHGVMPRIPKAAGRAANAAATRLRLGQPPPEVPEVVHLQRRRYEAVTSDLPPATWRHVAWPNGAPGKCPSYGRNPTEHGGTRVMTPRYGDDMPYAIYHTYIYICVCVYI